MAQINKYANIYDIDGNLINKVGETGKLPKADLEKVEALVDELTKKVAENPDNQVYKVYLNNTNGFLYYLYNNMSNEDLAKRISVLSEGIENAKKDASETDSQTFAQINEEIEKLKSSVENDAPVEDTDVAQEPQKDTVMDEYVPYEEIK